MTHCCTASAFPRRQAGFSLIELMISITIGLVVIGAVFAAYLGSGVAGRNSQALSQVNEDANIALNVLRSQLMMAGFSQPSAVVNGGEFTPSYAGVGLFGCDGANFADPSLAIGNLTCGTAKAGDPDSVAVAYQTDASMAPVDGAGKPLNCQGDGITAAGGIFVNVARFYLATPSGGTLTALYCRGESSTSAQALVDNVVDMQLSYGVAADATQTENRRVLFYAAANAPLSAANFANVAAIKLCIVVASATEVMDDRTPYQGCDPFAGQTTPADKRLYKAFTTTFVMQNRLGALLPGT